MVPFPSDFKHWGNRKKSNPPSDHDLKVAGKKLVQDFFILHGGVDPIPDEHILIVPTMVFPNQISVRDRRSHIGMNVKLLIGMFADEYNTDSHRMNLIIAEVASFLSANMEAETPLYIMFVCRSGRHRSVLCANVFRHLLSDEQGKFRFSNWTHFCEFYWRAVTCQKRGFDQCDLCREDSCLTNPTALDIVGRFRRILRHALILVTVGE